MYDRIWCLMKMVPHILIVEEDDRTARGFVSILQKKGFQTRLEYRIWCKKNETENIPSTPDKVYKGEWTNWGDFLGTGRLGRNRIYLSIREARDLVKKKGIKTGAEYKAWWYENRPENMPISPDRKYAAEWQGWREFLGKK